MSETIDFEGQEYEIATTYSTQCEHQWAVASSDPNSDMVSYQCLKCPAGMNKSKELGE